MSDSEQADGLLLGVARHGGAWIVVLIVSAVTSAVATIFWPAVLGRALDAALGGADVGPWLLGSAALVAVIVLGDALSSLADQSTSAQATAWLRHALVRHLFSVGTPAIRRFTSGDLVSRVVGNAAEAGRVGAAGVWAFTAIIPSVGSVIALALIDPWLCVAFVAAYPLLLLLLRSFVRDTSNLATQYLESQGTIAARMIEALSGARTIAAAGTLDREVTRVLAPLAELNERGRGIWKAYSRTAARTELFALVEVVVLAVAGYELARGRITAGELLAATQYVGIGMGLGGVVSFLTQLSRVRAGARRAAEVLAEPPTVYGTRALPPGRGELEFRNVGMSMGGERVLDGLNLRVPGGASVAVVGRSGSGKSLLAALAGRLADPDEGQVLIDGIPIRQLSRRELRSAVAYGFDRPALVGTTLADAIGLGDRALSKAEVDRAARSACVDVVIRHLPRGYQTKLADAPMSGGEIQRIGLARAFAHAGRVLVLDDATSSLDTVTELQISRALTDEYGDRTRLVVAHRASTAARTDLVAWLDGGRVRALGPHQELWKDLEYRAVFVADPRDGDLAGMAHAANGDRGRSA